MCVLHATTQDIGHTCSVVSAVDRLALSELSSLTDHRPTKSVPLVPARVYLLTLVRV